MDVRAWKKILLQWIKECGLVERNYFNIEQSDIDVFYRNFCTHHHRVGESSAVDQKNTSLSAFLQTHYPDFQPNLDDENGLSSADYIYVYSLLLHFSCVKFPDPYFHDICQKLSEQSQQCIASFFKELIDCAAIDKEHLRHAIANVAATHLSPQHNDSVTSSSGGSGGSLPSPIFPRLESPMKTPKRSAATAQRISPSTPKTFLLEERTRELYNLRAQLDTERYEKGLLEVQIKQNEDKILKLNQDHKRLQQQIQELKNDILTQNTETSSPNRGGDEQIKRRLCKEILQKEQEISKLTDILNGLREEKTLVENKLNFAEQQIVVCMNRIKELDFRVDELTAELEHKNGTIKYLTDNKLELEQFISETRSASTSSRPDLNSSVDCLNVSFSRASHNNTSSELSSPENLGSVVDMQLREKESENVSLRGELTAMRQSNSLLLNHMHQLISEHCDSKEAQQRYENEITQLQNEFLNSADQYNIFINCIDKIANDYKEEKNRVCTIQLEATSLQEVNSQLSRRLEECEKELLMLKSSIQSVDSANCELESDKVALQKKLAHSESEFELLNEKTQNLTNELESMTSSLEKHRANAEARQNGLLDQIKELQSELSKLRNENSSLQSKLLSKTTEHELEVKSLNERLADKTEQLQAQLTVEQSVKENYEKIVIQYEKAKQSARESNSHLETMRSEIAEKELEMDKLGGEIVVVSTQNSELEKRIDQLMDECKSEKQSSNMALHKHDERIQEIETQRVQLEALVEEAKKQMADTQREHEQSKEKLHEANVVIKEMYKNFNVPSNDIPTDLCLSLTDLASKMEELLKVQAQTVERLELKQTAKSDEVETLNEVLQVAVKKHEVAIEEYSSKIVGLEASLSEKQTELILQKDDHKQSLQAIQSEHRQALLVIESDLRAKSDQLACKERELLVVISEHNDLKHQLKQTESQVKQLQQEKVSLQGTYTEKMNSFDEQLNASKERHDKREHELVHMMTELDGVKSKLEEDLKAERDNFESKNREFQLIVSEHNDLKEQLKNELNDLRKLHADKERNLLAQIEKLEKELNTEKTHLSSKDRDMREKHENELKINREQLASKECELLVVIGQHNDVNNQLEASELQIKQLQQEKLDLQSSYSEKIGNFEKKIENFVDENSKLIGEIKTFKQEHNAAANRLLNADTALTQLTELIKEANNSKSELEQKLQSNEVQFKNALQQKSTQLNDLQIAFDSQMDTLNNAIRQVEQLKAEQLESIDTLEKKLKRLRTENENVLQNAAEFTENLEREQQEKAVILRSLEVTADQLKEALEQNSRESTNMQQRCADLQAAIEEANDQNSKIQKKYDELALNERALTEIMSILENNANFCVEQKNTEIDNLFNAEENEIDCNLNRLKRSLNALIFNISQLNVQLEKAEQSSKETTDKLAKTTSQLNDQQKRNHLEITELRNSMTAEKASVESKLNIELKRLNDDLHNLENVNDRLTDENSKLQLKLSSSEEEMESFKISRDALEAEKNQSVEDLQRHKEMIERIQREESKLCVTLKAKEENLKKVQEKCLQLEQELNEKSRELTDVTAQLQASNEKASNALSNVQKVHQELSTTQRALNEKHEQIRLQRTSNETLESELALKSRDSMGLQTRIGELSDVSKRLEIEVNETTQKLDQTIALNLASESKYEKLNSQFEQLQRDYDLSKSQHQAAVSEIDQLTGEMDALKLAKLQLNDEVKETKLELQRANDNVSELIQQIASIRLEKESLVEENQLLVKQFEENGKYKSATESTLKTFLERSQLLERKLLTSEKELKSLESIKTNAEKLSVENKKLRDAQEALNKRIEKMALKLGDAQARCSRLERDNDKLSKSLEANKTTVEVLQREKDSLQNDGKSLKERLVKAERSQEQLSSKVQALEQVNLALKEAKQKLEASEIDGKTKLNKLEKMRDANEEKIRKLNNALNNSEHSNVRLNLEIGALNSELIEVRNTASTQRLANVEEISKNLNEAKEEARKYEALSVKLETDARDLVAQNATIGDQLSKLSLSLQISKEKCETLSQEMDGLRADLHSIKAEKSEIEREHLSTCSKLKDFESINAQLVSDKCELVAALEAKVSTLESLLASKEAEISTLHMEVELLQAKAQEKATSTDESSVVAAELDSLRTRLSITEEVLDKEQKASTQLRLDNQILQAKYRESKQRSLDESKTSEERIKENRLELEGKLEKMKNKMKTLYTEEITKMKAKQEREILNFKSEMDVLKNQNIKYEEHTRKLSNQIVRLNDNLLENQKQNAMLSTRLRHMEEHEPMSFKRPNSIHVSTISAATSSASTNLGTNLAMEDEEGEVFNNTYLTDLKNGRLSEHMSKDICVEELQHRNSMLPPHLKSTYAAQYDHGLPEDELKDGPHSLDDSMSALLSTTAGGTRKKVTGATHYKRPGPPTPSKNGGRLSFGGISEPAREILKETYDNSATGTVSSSKTPARFGFFASRFSMGNNTKDEPIDCADLRKAVQKKNYKLLSDVGVVCTSTPRKSKTHYDQRRLIDQFVKSSPSPSPLSVENEKRFTQITPPDVSLIGTPAEAQPESGLSLQEQKAVLPQFASSRRRRSLRTLPLQVVRKSTPSKIVGITPGGGTTSSGGHLITLRRRLRRRPKRERGSRPSLNLCGNIFAKYRTPTRGTIRDLNRNKARKQRTENYNKRRMIRSIKVESPTDPENTKNATFDMKNNNYKHFNHNYNLGQTVVVIKDEPLEGGEEEHDYDENCDGDDDYFDENDTLDMEDDCMDDSECMFNDTVDDDAIEINEDTDEAIKMENIKEELVTSQDLAEFDQRIDQQLQDPVKSIDYIDDGDSQHFEQLVTETASAAPFHVKHIQFSATIPLCAPNSSQQPSQSSQASDSLPSTSSLALVACSTVISAASPQLATPSNSAHLSRTIYGGSVIYNRRIPHVNTTHVRKSSIYIKNRDPTALNEEDIILVTNQTITIVDLMRMWKQMDSSTRLIVAFAALASMTTLACLFIAFFSKR